MSGGRSVRQRGSDAWAALGEAAGGWRRRQARQAAGDALEIADGARVRRRGANQGRRIGMARRGEELGGRRLLDDLAGMHHDDPLGIGAGERQIVGDEERRHVPGARMVEDEIENRRLGGRVEPGRRLVGDEQRRVAGKRDGDHHALAHAAGELARIGPGARLRLGNADCGERRVDRFVELAGAEAAMLADHVADLAADRAQRIERRARILEDDADLATAEAGPAAPLWSGQVDAAEGEPLGAQAGRRAEDAGNRMCEQRLARAALADKCDDLAARRSRS